jgi:hypothetical protein
MATIKTEIATLIGRCRRVGWDVVMQGNEHKVTFDDGSMTLIHSSYSDRNAVHRVLRRLDKMGLSAKEQAIDEKHEADKSARLAAERKAAQLAGSKMAKEAAMTAKAAGPYAPPEHVPLDWFLADHPAPWMRWVIITPDLAEQLLKRNTDNRPLNAEHTAYFKRLILAGEWRLTHQGMAIDVNHVLQDGQHRLHACVEAGRVIAVPFYCGMPAENFKYVDEGRNRSIADLFGIEGVVQRTTMATTIKLVEAYRDPFPRSYMRSKASNAHLFDAFKGDPEHLVDAVKWARRHYDNAKVVATALSAATYLLRDANGRDNVFVSAFLTGLATGVKGGGDSRILLDKDDPRMLLRKDMQRRRELGNRLRAVDQLGYILLAWNLVVDRKQAGKRIKWTEGRDDIPRIVVCKDKGARASAPPDKLRGEFTGDAP